MNVEQAQAAIIAQLMQGCVFEYKNICMRLVAHDPVLFAKLSSVEEFWVAGARAFWRDGQAISCIKTIRENTGLGLWEAKQVWDRLRSPAGSLPCEESRWTPHMEQVYKMVK
jgi:ribosomal protein L7/L12